MGQLGVAFVRGLNMFGQNRITGEEMRHLLTEIEDDTLQIIDLYRADNIIFQKTGIHYAQAGLRIQMVLRRRFGREIWVTTRSVKTLEQFMKKIQKLEDQNV